MTLNWSRLVAVGAMPLLLAVLPRAAMCALRMCMDHGKGDAGRGGGRPPGADHKPDADGGRG